MFYSISRNWIAAVGLSVMASLSFVTDASPLTGGVDVGAETICGTRESPIISEGAQVASCTALGDTSMASADLPNAEVKVYVESPDFHDSPGSEAAFVDFITVTEGWDGNGQVTGTLQLDVEGMVDDSDIDNISEVSFIIAIWYPSDPIPPFFCISDIDCGFYQRPFDYASVFFGLYDGVLNADFPFIISDGTGSGLVLSSVASDLRAFLSVTFTVDEANPSFYISVYGGVGTDHEEQGLVDFFNTAKAGLKGPAGFTYTSKNGFASQVVIPPPSDGPVELNGNVQNSGGTPLCAMVLASGQFQFSCDPNGPFSLTNLPREGDGTVKRQVYVDGFFPRVDVLQGSVSETVVMQKSGECPDYNTSYIPASSSGSAGKRVDIRGAVLLGDSGTPICAMVLANGQFEFSCDGSGNYNMNIPLDGDGQFKLQVYADGFAPYTSRYDEFSLVNDAQLARASECK
jgi:hypothetical protein